jgi:hypothetical protein
MPSWEVIEQHIQNMEEALAHNNEIATLRSQ